MFEKMLEEMRVEDFLKLQRFHELAHEALEAEKVVKDVCFKYAVDTESLQVYEYEAFSEYYGYATLSRNCMWHYHDNWWGGRDWYIPCTADGIYELFRNAYLEETKQQIPNGDSILHNAYITETHLPMPPEGNTFETPATHFRRFIEETKAKLNSES